MCVCVCVCCQQPGGGGTAEERAGESACCHQQSPGAVPQQPVCQPGEHCVEHSAAGPGPLQEHGER